MITATELRRKPLLGQLDLRCIREAAARIVNISDVAPYLPRDLTRAEGQLLTACAAVCDLVVGSLGEDDDGPIGDLELRVSPTLPSGYQMKLMNGNRNGNGTG